jgi:UDP-3-O-[3-hydroxymyristoyl] glucosamine N-acyltransferase
MFMVTYSDLLPILQQYQYVIIGNPSLIKFAFPTDLKNQNLNAIVWVKDAKSGYDEILANTIICKSSKELRYDVDTQVLIEVDNPKFLFSQIVNKFFVPKPKSEISIKSDINGDAIIGDNVSIGPFTTIGSCKIGNNVVIKANCTIYDNVEIHDNVTINAGAVIGCDGFGYSKNEHGVIEKFPHIGGVVIESDVEIGANTCIDRGALGNTVIGSGTKVDNLVHIAHNVIVGSNCYIIANAMVGGSVQIEDNVWIGPSTSIMQQVNIGSNALTGLGAIVTKKIPSNQTWAGSPAREISDFIKLLKHTNDVIAEK